MKIMVISPTQSLVTYQRVVAAATAILARESDILAGRTNVGRSRFGKNDTDYARKVVSAAWDVARETDLDQTVLKRTYSDKMAAWLESAADLVRDRS